MVNKVLKKLLILSIMFIIALFSFGKVVEAVSKDDSVDTKKAYSADQIVEYVEKVYGVTDKAVQGGHNYSVSTTIHEESSVLSAWKNTLARAGYKIDNATQKGNAVLYALYNNADSNVSSGGGSGSSSGSGGGSGSSSSSGGGSGSSSTSKEPSTTDSDDVKKAYTAEQIKEYIDNNYGSDKKINGNESDDVIAAWKATLEGEGWSNINLYNTPDAYKYQTFERVVAAKNDMEDYDGVVETPNDHPIYQQPKRDNNTSTASESLDDMMNDADDFVSSGGAVKYNQSELQNFSSNMYNILLTVGVAVAVIVGGILGIKLMLSSVEEKAETKKLLVAYAIGCLIVFGGFGIWKLVITILEGL